MGIIGINETTKPVLPCDHFYIVCFFWDGFKIPMLFFANYHEIPQILLAMFLHFPNVDRIVSMYTAAILAAACKPSPGASVIFGTYTSIIQNYPTWL
jgi:hypothetical protein